MPVSFNVFIYGIFSLLFTICNICNNRINAYINMYILYTVYRCWLEPKMSPVFNSFIWINQSFTDLHLAGSFRTAFWMLLQACGQTLCCVSRRTCCGSILLISPKSDLAKKKFLFVWVVFSCRATSDLPCDCSQAASLPTDLLVYCIWRITWR